MPRLVLSNAFNRNNNRNCNYNAFIVVAGVIVVVLSLARESLSDSINVVYLNRNWSLKNQNECKCCYRYFCVFLKRFANVNKISSLFLSVNDNYYLTFSKSKDFQTIKYSIRK